MAKIPYTKTPQTHVQQLQTLKDRGLKIDSDNKTLHLLEKLSYYRLSGYWYPLLEDPKSAHKFKKNASFQTAFKLYRFDRDLRIFILKEIEKIEVAVKAQMIYTFSHYKGAFWYLDQTIFTDATKFNSSIDILKNEFRRSDEEFIKAFRDKYSNPLPPSWMMFEIASFGCLSIMFENLKPGKSKREISHRFGLDDSTFTSWMHSFAYVRNVCAHHSRFWNRGMSIKPQIPLHPINTWLKDDKVSNNKAYYILSMMLYLLQSIDPKHQFIFRLTVLLKKYPNIDVSAMGFPSQWKKETLWNFKPTIKQRIRLLVSFAVR